MPEPQERNQKRRLFRGTGFARRSVETDFDSEDLDAWGQNNHEQLVSGSGRLVARRKARMDSRWTVLVIGAATYLFVATFPGRFLTLQPGLDSSWAFAVNQLPHLMRGFGSELAFTWGPLAHLAIPIDVEANVARAVLFWTLTQAMVVAVLIHTFRRDRNPLPILAFTVAYLVAYSFGAYFEYQVIFVVGLLLTIAPEDGGVWPLASVSAAALSGMLLFMKLSTGLSAASIIAVVGVMWVLRREARVRDVALFLWLPWLITILALGAWAIGGIGELPGWLALGVNMSAGYAIAMSGETFVAILVSSLIGFGLLIALIIVLSRMSSRTMSIGVAFVIPAYLALRHSFVRHNGRFVGPVLLGIAALLILRLRSRRALFAGALGFVILLVPVATIAISEGCGCQWNPRLLTPAAGWSSITRIIDLPNERRQLARLSDELLADDELPSEWLRVIGQRTVDVIPWELSIVPANDLRWIASPTIQTYQVVTPFLDRLVAEHFAGSRAPDFLIFEFGDIDYRHALWGAPAMWRSILNHYVPSDVQFFGNRILLERRSGPPAKFHPRTFLDESVPVGRWHRVPTRGPAVIAYFGFVPRPIGRLATLLWQVPPIQVDVRYVDGQTWTHRILPSTASDGVLMSPLPRAEWELLDWVNGDPAAPVVSFRIRGSGTGLYRDPVDVSWAIAAAPTV
jgi:hypothetical protein